MVETNRVMCEISANGLYLCEDNFMGLNFFCLLFRIINELSAHDQNVNNKDYPNA